MTEVCYTCGCDLDDLGNCPEACAQTVDLDGFDFDLIADNQGWSVQTMLWIACEFISKRGLSDDLAAFAKGKAEDENEEADKLNK